MGNNIKDIQQIKSLIAKGYRQVLHRFPFGSLA